MITEKQLKHLEALYGSEDNCVICGTTNGIHKLITREDGSCTFCGGGDLCVMVKEIRQMRPYNEKVKSKNDSLDHFWSDDDYCG
jgi:hypothetical protein